MSRSTATVENSLPTLRELTDEILQQEQVLREGGGPSGQARQRKLGRLPVRERLAALLDEGYPFFEINLWAAYGMYEEWGGVPAAGVVTGIGWVSGRPCFVVANDATVKAGAVFPQTAKKVLRAQRIAFRFRLPVIYLVDSAGAFLPLQDEIFPDEDDFGRIFRNNSVMSAAGIPQYAAIMGNCIAGGAYLPVLSDITLMTEGSQLCLAGPALVKAAIGQEVDPEELGGAKMHATLSGTVDYYEPNDAACLLQLRSLMALLPEHTFVTPSPPDGDVAPARDPQDLYDIVSAGGRHEYEMRDVIACIADAGTIDEYRAEFGQSLVTVFARIGGHAVGIVASQQHRTRTAEGEVHIGGVIYPDSAEKAARFVMNCNQSGLPLVFLQDVQGFMVGKRAEQAGIIRSGAKLVNAMSNSVVPKLTVIVGGSYGAGNYALCGKAYDPVLMLAWAGARNSVMGGAQAADTLLQLRVRDAQRKGEQLSAEQIAELRDSIRNRYDAQTDIRYGAARGWIDAIIPPHETRTWLQTALDLLPSTKDRPPYQTGVFQV
ncbi:MAG: acyl-CoA carboxylase subunit beta [Planctomycetaceae bacterium]